MKNLPVLITESTIKLFHANLGTSCMPVQFQRNDKLTKMGKTIFSITDFLVTIKSVGY